jgi:hypothetical protein
MLRKHNTFVFKSIKMAVFVCGLNPRGNAFRDGRMREGDIVLEANGILLHHRHHLNASALIKNLPETDVAFVLLRYVNDCLPSIRKRNSSYLYDCASNQKSKLLLVVNKFFIFFKSY